MSPQDVEAHWQRLDPIFILGKQRSGTSIMWRALRPARFLGFPEGHLWYDLIKPLAWWRDPEYKGHLREDLFTLGAGRNRLLEKRLALLIDRFHRDLLPPDLVRWVSKSPGVDAALVAPMLAKMFPQAQFIFMQRNPITTVNSTLGYVSKSHGNADLDYIFRFTCEDWVRVMQIWRRVRPLLTGRYLQVAQEQIASEPDQIARQVADFLHVPQRSQAIASAFKSQRENTAFPDKPVGDFFYPVDWTTEQKQYLVEICGPEMAIWGYPLNFQRPGGADPSHAVPTDTPPMDTSTYYRWIQKWELERRSRELWQQLQRIKQGRLMQLLNCFHQVRLRLLNGLSKLRERFAAGG